MQTVGYIAASFIGISLGLIGGGGSILTVPVLVYLFGLDPMVSTLYSLFIVGTTSAVGTISYIVEKNICYPTAFAMGVSSVTTVLLVRHFLLPSIPPVLFNLGGVTIGRDMAMMVLFAFLMVISAYFMIKSKEAVSDNDRKGKIAFPKQLLLYGVGIGLITGILGAGGGFLLIPTFVIMLAFPMRKAVGTSLLVIAINSLIGFFSDVGHYEIIWSDLLIITALASAGILVGAAFGKRIDGMKLKRTFGFFVLAVGIFILLKVGASYT